MFPLPNFNEMESCPKELHLARARPRLWSITPFRILVLLSGLGVWTLIGYYYFNSFTIRTLDDPLYDLVVIKADDPRILADFRRTALTEYLGPTTELNARMVALRKESQACTIVPTDASRRCKALADELRSLMKKAKRERVPQVNAKVYAKLLIAISETYRSLRAFETALAENDPDKRRRELERSIILTRSAKANLDRVRGRLTLPVPVEPPSPLPTQKTQPPVLSKL